MFTRAKEPTLLDDVIERSLNGLMSSPVDSEEYALILERVTKLHKLKQEEASSGFSKDALLSAGASLLGILMIINHEHLHPITTRAMGMVPKPK